MTRLSKVLRTGLFLLILLLLTSAGQGAERADLLRYLPPDTLLAIYIPSVPELLQKWDGSPFYRFYGDPRAGAFFAPLRGRIEGFKRTMNAENGVDPERVWRFFSGGLVLAGVAAPESRDAMEWVLIFEHNGDAQMVEKFRQGPQKAGARLQRSTANAGGLDYTRTQLIREVRADVPLAGPDKKKHGKNKKHKTKVAGLTLAEGETLDLSIPAPQAGGAAGSSALPLKKQVVEAYDDYVGRSLLIHAGAKGRPIERVLPLVAQPAVGTSLAGRSEVARLREALGGGGDLRVYANVAALARIYEREALDKSMRRVFDLEQLRLSEVKAAGANLNLLTDRAAVEVALLAPPPRTGVSRMLFLPAGKPPEAARLTPAGAVAYSAASLPLGDFWRLTMETMQLAAPTIFLALDSQLRLIEQNAGIGIEQGLIGNLGGGVARFLLPSGKSARNPRELATYMVGLKNSAAFRDTLASLLQYGAQMYGAYHVEKTQLGSWPLWILYSGPANANAQGKPILHLCVTDRWLLAGARRDGIDAVIKRLGKTNAPRLSDDKAFQSVMSQLPQDRFGEMYLDTGGVRKLVESGVLQALNPGKSGKKGRDKKGWLPVDLRQIPADPAWDEYFGPIGSATRQTEDMLRWQTFLLYP